MRLTRLRQQLSNALAGKPRHADDLEAAARRNFL
jgi:hypothetical protein